jgi:hypothetical protein
MQNNVSTSFWDDEAKQYMQNIVSTSIGIVKLENIYRK